MDSPLLSTHGAVPADPPDAQVAAHYGEPSAEQRALATGAAVVDRGNRGVVRVAGADRLRFLHSLMSQHLERMAPYTPTEALLLSPNGHVEHHLALVDDGEAVWAHVEPGTAAGLAEFLDRMRFMMRVEVTDETASYAVVTLSGVEPPEDALVTTDGLIVPRETLDRDWHARLAGLWAYEALRIAAHRPRFGLDTDHRTIPHEAGWIDVAVHLDKGCYRGQETVARVQNLGRPPRRLVFLHLDGSVDHLPAHGDPIEFGGRTVGFVGSAARHYELGPIALGMVKRNVPVEETLLAGGVAATQEVIVSPDTGSTVKIDLRRR
ncbi:YgfZ/GcvT domain-containing protein [Actinoallomurus iriomotensis]|uniref:Folate-binding protein n=1 Tax=Actinoallomurus iriomotensis TaxID=478107 RepID=A0A9W6VSS0_9ACTN|nr:glycine cleavage T C-terminal barrel domain-containing protein [Actinoallomurus iriomotensis]GLY83663.1 folate-binding protein [Actinoallomurus iriomotensis]